jgi:hypothetical protein
MTEQAAQVETAAAAASAASHRLRGETCRSQANRGNHHHHSIQQSTLHGSILQNSVKRGKHHAIHDCNARHLEALHKRIVKQRTGSKPSPLSKNKPRRSCGEACFKSSLKAIRRSGRATTAARATATTAAGLAAAAAAMLQEAEQTVTMPATAGRLFLRAATGGLRRSTATRGLSGSRTATRRLSRRGCCTGCLNRCRTRRLFLRAATGGLRRTARAAFAALALEQAQASIGLALERYRNTNQDRHCYGSTNNKSAIHLNPPHEKHRAGGPMPQPHQTC